MAVGRWAGSPVNFLLAVRSGRGARLLFPGGQKLGGELTQIRDAPLLLVR